MMATFNEFEHAAWEAKAERYADTWGALTAQPMERMLELARVEKGTKLLDVGSGPGTLTHLAARRGAEVTGCDYSEAMLEIARGRFPGLTFVREDAEHLSFADSSFDAVILNYLLLHVSDQRKTLLEAARVLKKGGRLAFSLWVRPADSPGLGAIFEALREHADMSVIPPADDIFLFSDGERAKEFFSEHGFIDPVFERFETAWRAPSFDAYFTAVQSGTRMGGLIDHQRPEVKARIRSALEKKIEAFRAADGYRISMPSVLTCAVKA